MLPGLEMMAACTDMAVPLDVMRHVAAVESSHNPYAIGVVGGRLVRQPRNLAEAVSTARMLEDKGRNFSLGIAQVNRYNLASYGLDSYEKAFDVCSNVRAGARILAQCYQRSGNDWGKAFSCYYSGNFTTGFRHGYVQKVFSSLAKDAQYASATPIPLAAVATAARGGAQPAAGGGVAVANQALLQQRVQAQGTAQRSRTDREASVRQPARWESVNKVVSAAVAPAVPPSSSGSVAQPLAVRFAGSEVRAAASAMADQPAATSDPLPTGAAPPARDAALVF